VGRNYQLAIYIGMQEEGEKRQTQKSTITRSSSSIFYEVFSDVRALTCGFTIWTSKRQ
jgi:hypothetical protein